MRPLGLRHIEVIQAVMLAGTVTGAAARLHVSQPAVSNALKDAEARLGFALFVRRQGRIFPTEHAHAIFREIERSFTGLDAINSLCGLLKGEPVQRVVISSTPAWSASVLPLVLRDFMQVHPELRFSIITRSSEYVQALVSSCKADIGFGLYAPPIPGVDQIELLRARLHCIVAEDHRLAARETLTFADLAAEPMVTFSGAEGTDRMINNAFEAAGVNLVSVVECPAALTVYAMVTAGVAVALMHDIGIHAYRGRGVRKIRFEPRLETAMCAYWRADEELEFDHRGLIALAARHGQSVSTAE